MIQVDQHEGSYLSICKHYRAIYDTPCILEDSSKWQQVHSVLLVFFCIVQHSIMAAEETPNYCYCTQFKFQTQ